MCVADAEGFNVRRRQHRSIRFGEDVEVRRSPQAVACRKRYVVELGKPQRLQEKVLDQKENGSLYIRNAVTKTLVGDMLDQP
jgi:hypothetical protein